MRDSGSNLDLSRNGRRIRVSRSTTYPKSYLWIDIDDGRFFLGVLRKEMSRGDVRRMAEKFLAEHPQHLAT